jgi:hypothetical protein
MRDRRKTLMAMALIVAVVGYFACINEPVHNGVTINEWFRSFPVDRNGLMGSRLYFVHLETTVARNEAIPFLLQEVRKIDSPFQKQFYYCKGVKL